MAMARVFLLLLVGAAATVNDCIEQQCKGCGGEQCQLCREDAKTISTCVDDCIESACKGCGGEQCQLCREDAKTTTCKTTEPTQPEVPTSPCDGVYGAEGLRCAWYEDVKTCMEKTCQGCGGEQCQLCREDAKNTCKATQPEPPKNPCDGVYGAEGLQCVWEESVKTCMEKTCHGCGGEQCQLCRSDATRIAQCCDDHWHSVDPPQMCKEAKAQAVSSCVESKCKGCGGEQCQLCRNDQKVLDECCTGAMRTPQCEKTRAGEVFP
mmetsp:Transcript_101608/g.124378  ORF Transcript_101608/g.124378 Transcript_101608/m.124378 type:complete len:265 (+) Transcript_101608:60-854(+)